jgi:signal transduction histidine kinase
MRIAGQELRSLSLLVLSHNAESSTSIADYLRHTGVTVTHSTTPEMAQAALEIGQPDVVLALDQDLEAIEWLINLKQSALVAPVTIMLTDNLLPDDLQSSLDLIIPPDSLPYLAIFLQPYLKIRGHLAEVESHGHQLVHENERLKQELSAKQTPVVDVNLLKNSIVHSVSHELRTPMLQVKSAVALLAEDAGTNRNIVELALEATTRLEGGVRNVTLLNELMNESLETQSFSPVEMGQIIQSAIRNLRRSWEHKQAVDRIQVNIPDNVPPVWGDRQRLVIAIQLLLDNALKFSEKEVRIVATVTTDHLDIAIHDQGIGIPAEHLAHIFEPFYQVDGSSTRRFGGMGIGLAIVRFILDYHQTQIQVTTSPGKGSTFAFTLPIASPHSILG